MRGRVGDVMTERPRAVEPNTSVAEAARVMEVENVGSLPVVVEDGRVIGIVTDRDLAIRVLAKGLDPERTTVGQVASKELVAVRADQDLDEALAAMAQAQVRRLPVVDEADQLVGVVAQADLALTAKGKDTGQLVEEISKPPSGARV
jgi:CBS domain-containing protein